MPWQLIEGGKAVALGENGNPLWIPEDLPEGEEPKPVEVDWLSAIGTISRLNKENKERRETAKELEGKNKELAEAGKLFEGLDPKEARKALDTLKNIDSGKLLEAEKVEAFKRSLLEAAEAEKKTIKDSFQKQIETLEDENRKKESEIYRLVVSNSFTNSPYVRKLEAPPDMIEAKFRDNFKVEDGIPVAYLNGDKVFSRNRPGELASFDEAIEIIIEKYPGKDKLLPGQKPGSGGGEGGGAGQTITREQLRAMPLAEYKKAKEEGRLAPTA